MWNFIKYNVFGGGDSALYGVESSSFYLRNGLNNLNLILPLALVYPLVAMLDLFQVTGVASVILHAAMIELIPRKAHTAAVCEAHAAAAASDNKHLTTSFFSCALQLVSRRLNLSSGLSAGCLPLACFVCLCLCSPASSKIPCTCLLKALLLLHIKIMTQWN